jgi:DnaJ like chaperone protein
MSLSRLLAKLACWPAKVRSGEDSPARQPSEDPDFAMAVTALGAKLARADGSADQVEYEAFLEAFPPKPAAAAQVGRFYGLAGETTRGYEAYASKLGRRYKGAPKLLEDVIHRLFHVAKSDGRVSGDEIVFLEKVSGLFELSPLTFRRLQAEHLPSAANDPYVMLDVAPDAPDAEVRAAWRRALSEAHPDKAMGRGEPAEVVAKAAERTAALNAAFEEVMRERRLIGEAA